MLNKILHSSIFNSWFSASVGLLVSLIAIPIVITKLNVEEINLWFLLASITVIGNGVQFGFNTTFTRFIVYVNSGVRIKEFKNLRFKKKNKYGATIDEVEFSRVYYLMKKVYIYLSCVYLLALIIIAYFSLPKPISTLSNPIEGWIASCIVGFSSTLTLSFGYYQNFMLGINKVALVQRITGLVTLIGLLLIIGVLLFYPNLISIILVYQFVYISVLIFIIYYAKKEIRKRFIIKHSNSFDKELFSVVWESAWKSGVTTMVSNLVKNVSAILVTQFFTPTVSASFLFTKRIFDIIERFTMTTFNSRLPVIAKIRGQGNLNKLIPFLRQTQWISYGVFILGYIVLLIWGENILTLIDSNVTLGSFSLIILFSISKFISRWGGMTLSISNQSNHVVEHINAIITSIVYFSVIFFGIKHLGVEVFPLALLVSMLVVKPVIIKLVYKTLHTTYWKYENKVFIPIFGLLLLLNIVYFLIKT